ncbi:MAG: hypothetical protein U0531_21955 [Dehalococcoidia bacterium]
MRRTLILALAALALVGALAMPASADSGTTSSASGVLITVYNPGFVAGAVTGRVQNYPLNVRRLTVVLTTGFGASRNYDVGPWNGWSFVFQGVNFNEIKSVTVAGLPAASPARAVALTAGWLAPDVICAPFGYGYGYGSPWIGYGYGGGYYGGAGYGGYDYGLPYYGYGYGGYGYAPIYGWGGFSGYGYGQGYSSYYSGYWPGYTPWHGYPFQSGQ